MGKLKNEKGHLIFLHPDAEVVACVEKEGAFPDYNEKGNRKSTFENRPSISSNGYESK